MSQINEVVMAVIPGTTAEDRLLVVHRQMLGASKIELRQQTWGEGIGWFTQNTMPLAPQQVAQLRATFGGAAPQCASTCRAAGNSTHQLRIHAESA